MIPNHQNKNYNRTVSMINKLISDKERIKYFKKQCVYIPLIIVRTDEPGFDPYEDKPNLIIKQDNSYFVEIKNIPLVEKRKKKTPKINSKYLFDVDLLQEEEFINHLQKNKVYVKTMHSYMNGYFESYLMVYISDHIDKYEFLKNFNFLILANPDIKPFPESKCIIS